MENFYYFFIFFLHINVYFEGHLVCILQYRRGFLYLIHFKTEKQTSFALSVNSAHLYAFYVLNGIEFILCIEWDMKYSYS